MHNPVFVQNIVKNANSIFCKCKIVSYNIIFQLYFILNLMFKFINSILNSISIPINMNNRLIIFVFDNNIKKLVVRIKHKTFDIFY